LGVDRYIESIESADEISTVFGVPLLRVGELQGGGSGGRRSGDRQRKSSGSKHRSARGVIAVVSGGRADRLYGLTVAGQ
jgi:hypothetical protein